MSRDSYNDKNQSKKNQNQQSTPDTRQTSHQADMQGKHASRSGKSSDSIRQGSMGSNVDVDRDQYGAGIDNDIENTPDIDIQGGTSGRPSSQNAGHGSKGNRSTQTDKLNESRNTQGGHSGKTGR